VDPDPQHWLDKKYIIETPGWSWIGLSSIALSTGLTRMELEDFFLTTQFPDFLTREK
jgi:hypothetical protein